VLVGGYDFGGGESFGAIGEKRSILDEGLVGEKAVAYEDDGSSSNVESENGTVFGVEGWENWFDLKGLC